MKNPSRRRSDKLFVTVFLLLVFVFIGLFFAYLSLHAPPVERISGEYFHPLFGIYAFGNRPEQALNKPSDVAFDSAGGIYIADTGAGRVLVFDSGGRFRRIIGSVVGPDRLVLPMGISVDVAGRVYVADQARDRVVVYSKLGRVLNVIPVADPIKPLAFENRLYVAGGSEVRVFDAKTGRHMFAVQAPDKPLMAAGVAVGGNGDIFVSDVRDRLVRVFDRSGKYKRSLSGESSSGMTGRYGLPAGLAIDDQDSLYVVDAFNHEIEASRPGFESVRLSQNGQREGELYFPQGIAYWRDGIFAVADKHNDRVQVLKIEIPRPRKVR